MWASTWALTHKGPKGTYLWCELVCGNFIHCKAFLLVLCTYLVDRPCVKIAHTFVLNQKSKVSSKRLTGNVFYEMAAHSKTK